MLHCSLKPTVFLYLNVNKLIMNEWMLICHLEHTSLVLNHEIVDVAIKFLLRTLLQDSCFKSRQLETLRSHPETAVSTNVRKR